MKIKEIFRMKKIIFILLTNFLGILLSLYLFEFFLQLYVSKYPCTDFIPHFKRCSPPGENKFTWGHLVVNNKYGFRERDFVVPKPSDVFRIMVLGDSLTWGAGLDEKERYTNLLELYLNDYFSNQNLKKRIEVLNFGISGGPTTVERDILKNYKDLVQPDLIIVGFCLNDPQPKSQDWTPEKEKVDKLLSKLLNPLQKLLSFIGLHGTGVFISKTIYALLEKLGVFPPWYVGLERVYDKDSMEWKEFEKALKDIREMSDEMGLPPPIFAVLNQGVYTDRPTDYNNPDEMLKLYFKWYRQAEDTAKKIGFLTCNFEKEIASELPNKILAVNKFDGHPSAELNRVYAKKIFELIITNYNDYIIKKLERGGSYDR